MKFDLIVSNPPYNNRADIKILTSVLEMGENICFVHPVAWLYETNKNTKTNDLLKQKIRKRLKSVEMFNGNEKFNILTYTPIAITYFNNEENLEILIEDNSNFYHADKISYKVSDIYEINKYAFYNGYTSIKDKIERFVHIPIEIGQFKEKFSVGVARIRGNVASYDFYSIVTKDENSHYLGKYKDGYSFKTQIEQQNFYKFLKTKFVRFCISMTKIDANIIYDLLNSKIPMLDFSISWTDKECAKELEITDEELLWMIQQIPDYYPEDAETYRKLEEKLEDGSERIVLKIPPFLSPIKIAVMPLVKKDGLPEKAREIMDQLKLNYMCQYDEKDAIGRRYRRQDAIGTPYCITIDYDSLNDNTVTIRERDTMQQERIAIEKISAIVDKKLRSIS